MGVPLTGTFRYVFCVFFLLLNMFLAIISDTYSEVKADLSVSDRKYPVAEHIDTIKRDFMKKFNCLDPSDRTGKKVFYFSHFE